VTNKPAALTDLKFQRATASRWTDIERLFGERGACGGCWCMAWRLRTKDWEAGKGAKNKRAFKRIVTSGKVPGVVAYLKGEPVAWCAVAPRKDYSFLERSRALKPVDDKLVWSISCLFVLKPHRRQGISVRLLEAAVEFAGKRGARIVEGYPIQPTMKQTPDAFVWTGTPSAFTRAGFREVLRRSRTRPIMRRMIRPKRRGQEERRDDQGSHWTGTHETSPRKPTGKA
jgi:GNAT superfamily N-acetyltransferase